MSTPAIHVENLGKRYRLGETHSGSIREVVNRGVRRIFGRKESPAPQASRSDSNGVSTSSRSDFWALSDVSFSIEPGAVVGVIGRNGAGKSTLLKVLSGITSPTTGSVRLRGRVASLLEVGTGFHPELTGRENVFLNGAILGMTRAEVKAKFDEIVAFSEIEQFIDTPVKRYSSGMYVRLAFAVAAHLDPEILIVDEVLAVGDAAFQRKCLGKMEEVGHSGRTIVYVSHNLASVKNLCSQAIWLDGGRCRETGGVTAVACSYAANTRQSATQLDLSQRVDRGGSGRVRIIGLEIKDQLAEPIDSVCSGTDFTIHLKYELAQGCRTVNDVVVSLALSTDEGYVWLVRNSFTRDQIDLKQSTGEICCHVSDFAIAEGTYSLTIFLSHRETEILDHVAEAFLLRVEAGDFFGTGSHGIPTHCRVLTRAEWTA